MNTRDLIFSLILCGLVATCAIGLPDAMEYETGHQHAIAAGQLTKPITGYHDYQKFVAENK